MRSIRLPFTVPYAAQIASPSLARAIFDEGMDPVLDPGWAQSGAVSPEEYAYWARDGLARGGYRVTENPDGSQVERGWVHQTLADLITSADPDRFTTWPHPASADKIVQHLQAGCLVIASASFELGRASGAIHHKGGHLVVITGADLREDNMMNQRDRVECFYINNPSGRLPDLQVNACIPIERFLQASSGRIITAGLNR